jgi:cytidine deaminase
MEECITETISALGKEALDTRENAYQPYSEYAVGAAIRTDDGCIYRGCNVENATFTLTVHAEQNALTSAVAEGKSEFEALVIATNNTAGEPPCGVCRQTLAEFCSDDFLIVSLCSLDNENKEAFDGFCTIDGIEFGYNTWTLGELFPEAFRVFES